MFFLKFLVNNSEVLTIKPADVQPAEIWWNIAFLNFFEDKVARNRWYIWGFYFWYIIQFTMDLRFIFVR